MITTIIGGFLGVTATTTTYVLVDVPTSLSISFTILVCTTGYTSTVTFTNNGFIGIVGVPTPLLPSLQTSSAAAFTSTVVSNSIDIFGISHPVSTFVLVIVPTG
jgi:hypothetical protein